MADPADVTVTLIRDADGIRLRVRKLRVDVIQGPDVGLIAELGGPEPLIGTARHCDLVLHDDTVSRQHASLRVTEAGVRVRDRDSHNGTFVDGLRVFDALARPDSTITVGATALRLKLLADTVDLPLSTRERLGGLLGRSTAMRTVFSILERVAPTDVTVLVEGETGTGKELVAEALHDLGERATGPFVVLDCSAVSPTLIESELFGHVRGAFTGAIADRIGAFEAADRGTLFLDEIGELPLELQPKLLRALERLEVRRVGATTSTRADVRIVAATNRSLSREVEAGRFREDLYYRLAVVHVVLPPLRERADDIAMLVEHFVAQLSRPGQPAPALDRLVRGLQGRAWPGNVRELRNAVARTLSLGEIAGGERATDDLPPHLIAALVDPGRPLKEIRDRVADACEREYLRQVIEQAGGNLTRAAEAAGVSRKFVQRAVRRHGLRDVPDDD